ncbi:MAG: DUF3445 domain-containing protein [Pseudomonadota bacterium]
MPTVFADGPRRLTMGLGRLPPEDWLLVTEQRANELAEKRRLLAVGAEVLAELTEAEGAASELLATIEAYLARHHPELEIAIDDGRALVRAGLSVQEDLCLLLPGPAGHRLVAAFVAFPARWRLADKIGRPLATIHAPVPGFAERLGQPTERLFAGLKDGTAVWRANWSLVDDPSLHQPQPSTAAAAVVPEALHLRVERQCLSRLPLSGAVAFTIHTFVRPLTEVVADPRLALALADRLDEMPPDMLAYKALDRSGTAAARYLREQCGAG